MDDIKTQQQTITTKKPTAAEIEHTHVAAIGRAHSNVREALAALDSAQISSKTWGVYRGLIAQRDGIRKQLAAGASTHEKLTGIASPGFPDFASATIDSLLEKGGYVGCSNAILSLYPAWLSDRQLALSQTEKLISELAQQNGFEIPA
jgi:hypothetical protein